jgi:hypothetical protein
MYESYTQDPLCQAVEAAYANQVMWGASGKWSNKVTWGASSQNASESTMVDGEHRNPAF